MSDLNKMRRLKDAAALYPELGLTVQTLRTERDKGNLRTYIVAGKEFTTEADVEVMFKRCAVTPKALASGSDLSAETDQAGSPTAKSGSSETASGKSALAAALEEIGILRGTVEAQASEIARLTRIIQMQPTRMQDALAVPEVRALVAALREIEAAPRHAKLADHDLVDHMASVARAALLAVTVGVKPEAALRVQAMLDADPQSTLFGVATTDLRAILAALEPQPADPLSVPLTPQKAAQFIIDHVLQEASADAARMRVLMAQATMTVRHGSLPMHRRWSMVNEAIYALAALRQIGGEA